MTTDEKVKKGQTKAKKGHFREIAEAVIVALVLAVLIRTFFIQAFKIPSGSMEDTLVIGDHIIVSKLAYGLQVPRPATVKLMGASVPFLETRLVPAWGGIEKGDVVVFRFPGDRSKDYIKRVVGLPGDRVEVRDKKIYINNEKWEEPFGVNKGASTAKRSRKCHLRPVHGTRRHGLRDGRQPRQELRFQILGARAHRGHKGQGDTDILVLGQGQQLGQVRTHRRHHKVAVFCIAAFGFWCYTQFLNLPKYA
jgi:signal peptidase I